MAILPYRDATFGGMHGLLRAAFPEMSGERQIVRNPTSEIASDDILPVLRCYDGPHVTMPAEIIGCTSYRLTWRIEGCVGTENGEEADAGALDRQMNEIHARIVEAITTNGVAIEIPLVDGVLEIYAEETSFDVNRMGAAQSEFPTIVFTQDFALDLELGRGVGFVEIT